jgi:hypothetical protein
MKVAILFLSATFLSLTARAMLFGQVQSVDPEEAFWVEGLLFSADGVAEAQTITSIQVEFCVPGEGWEETFQTQEIRLFDGSAELGSVASLPEEKVPGVNFALLTNLAPEATYTFEARGTESFGQIEQAVVRALPMGPVQGLDCRQDTAKLCDIVICWENPGPPASGFEVSVDGDYATFKRETIGSVEQVLAISTLGEHCAVVSSILDGQDPNLPFQPTDPFTGEAVVGFFRGAEAETCCDFTCGAPPPPRFVRGDCENSGGSPDISSAFFGLHYLFLGGSVPSCIASCDVNDDGSFEISDMLHLLFFLFSEGSPIPGWEDSDADGSLDPTCVEGNAEDDCESSHAACE